MRRHPTSTKAAMVGTALSAWLVAATATAQPDALSEEGTDQDATITLHVRSQGIIDDPRFWCAIEIDVVGVLEPFTVGDEVLVEFIEDDAFVNDLLWSATHVITQAEADANEYAEVFDCSAPVMADGVGQLELFAQAEVTKDACGIGCLYDRPQTANIAVEGVDDDAFEDDDSTSQAPDANLGVTEERVARDEDWLRITLDDTGEIEATFSYMTKCGEVDAVLLDDANAVVGEIEPGDDAGILVATGLSAGTYFLQIQPTDPGDYNFYDLDVVTELTPGATTGDSASTTDDPSTSDSGGSNSSAGSGPTTTGDDSDGGSGDGGSGGVGESGGTAPPGGGCGCRPVAPAHPLWIWVLAPALRLRRSR